MASLALSLARLCDPAAEVSAHYLVAEDGTCLALVPEERRAWHAGAGRWGVVTDVNSRSIGIELQNRGDHPFPEPQMRAVERLLAGVLGRWAIPPARVVAHSDIAPMRKSDPGPRFDWRRLALSGLSVWPRDGAQDGGQDGAERRAESEPEEGDLGADLAAIGYDPSLPAEAALGALRLRFRPWASGPVDAADRRIARDLARRFPVDPGAAGA
jgi:N-acetylmuramoyl-L-alanine amidase